MPTKKDAKKAPEKHEDGKKAFQLFTNLTAMALDNPESEEARNSAVKALEMLADDDADLIVVPRADLEALQARVQGAAVATPQQLKAAKQEGMMVGGMLGLLLGKGKILG